MQNCQFAVQACCQSCTTLKLCSSAREQEHAQLVHLWELYHVSRCAAYGPDTLQQLVTRKRGGHPGVRWGNLTRSWLSMCSPGFSMYPPPSSSSLSTRSSWARPATSSTLVCTLPTARDCSPDHLSELDPPRRHVGVTREASHNRISTNRLSGDFGTAWLCLHWVFPLGLHRASTPSVENESRL